jgi:RNA polymerase sigma-70 factor (ECF subfamily)
MADVLPHARQFRFFARRLCPTADEAEDLLQEAYARVLAREDFRRIECGKAFVRRVLLNLALSKARRAKIVAIESIPDVDTLNVIDPAPDCYRQLEAREELARLEAAILALPAQCRQVVTLRKVHELSTTEIAAELSISVSTVEKHLTKGMRRVAATLSDPPPRTVNRAPFKPQAFEWADRNMSENTKRGKDRVAACAH